MDDLKLVKAASVVTAAAHLYSATKNVDEAIRIAQEIVEKAYASIV